MRSRASAAVATEEPVAPSVPRQTLRLVVPTRATPPAGVGLPDFIDVVGGSGRSYRFSRLRAGFPLSPVGGTFLLARHDARSLTLLCIAAAESLLRESDQIGRLAGERFGANQLFSRLNASGRTRDCELADILAAPGTRLQVLDRSAGAG